MKNDGPANTDPAYPLFSEILEGSLQLSQCNQSSKDAALLSGFEIFTEQDSVLSHQEPS